MSKWLGGKIVFLCLPVSTSGFQPRVGPRSTFVHAESQRDTTHEKHIRVACENTMNGSGTNFGSRRLRHSFRSQYSILGIQHMWFLGTELGGILVGRPATYDVGVNGQVADFVELVAQTNLTTPRSDSKLGAQERHSREDA
ncbi:hypothetical protein BKA81DRAFT_46109 [Phyllosticta paracitricarpa]|uniref:Secreted protein n=1 Tax=Phyllosticta citricarpa TaxID=55181 RepID=A0ABR1MRC3_9PEZI